MSVTEDVECCPSPLAGLAYHDINALATTGSETSEPITTRGTYPCRQEAEPFVVSSFGSQCECKLVDIDTSG